ncbi:MAG: tetratricopeptide repeat protein [Sneathiella sp.]
MKRFVSSLFGVFLATIILAPTANAGWNEGWDAFEKGNYATTIKEWKPLAEQGDVKAQYNLGAVYENGKGVWQDYKKAHMFYNLAASNGDAIGGESRDKLAKKMTPQQISEAQNMAREWLAKHQN